MKGSQCEGGEEGKGEEGREWHISAQTRTVCVCVCVCACERGRSLQALSLTTLLLHTASLSRHQLLTVSVCVSLSTSDQTEGRKRSNVVRKRKTWPVTEWVVVGHWWVTDGAQRKKAKVSMRMCSTRLLPLLCVCVCHSRRLVDGGRGCRVHRR